MPFPHTQLGRFGEFCRDRSLAHTDPDICAAYVLASNGNTHPSLQQVLGSKELLDPSHLLCCSWITEFSNLIISYQARGGYLLNRKCTKTWPLMPPGFCLHEFTPPLYYWSLRSFAHLARGTTVMQCDNHSVVVDPSRKPLFNYIITERGDILIGTEDFEWIKHTSLSGGMSVWSAGQVGLEHDKLRLVDLQSGHYVLGTILPGSPLAVELSRFTKEVFEKYCQTFGLDILHCAFTCI